MLAVVEVDPKQLELLVLEVLVAEHQVQMLVWTVLLLLELLILAVAAGALLVVQHRMSFILVPVVPVSSSSLTHHNKYLKNHNGF
jgi:hypothetical protein